MADCVSGLVHCPYFKQGQCLYPNGCLNHPDLIIGTVVKTANVKGQGQILVKSWNNKKTKWLPRFSACVRFGKYTGFRISQQY